MFFMLVSSVFSILGNNQDENCHATSYRFYGAKKKDDMMEKKLVMLPHTHSSALEGCNLHEMILGREWHFLIGIPMGNSG